MLALLHTSRRGSRKCQPWTRPMGHAYRHGLVQLLLASVHFIWLISHDTRFVFALQTGSHSARAVATLTVLSVF